MKEIIRGNSDISNSGIIELLNKYNIEQSKTSTGVCFIIDKKYYFWLVRRSEQKYEMVFGDKEYGVKIIDVFDIVTVLECTSEHHTFSSIQEFESFIKSKLN